MSNMWDIDDGEIRIVGSGTPPQANKPRKPRGTILIWVLSILAVLLVAAIFLLLRRGRGYEPNEPGLFEAADTTIIRLLREREEIRPFGDYTDTTGLAYTEVIEKTVDLAEENGLTVSGLSYSPVKGPEGNIEYLIHVLKSAEPKPFDKAEIDAVVEAAHNALDK